MPTRSLEAVFFSENGPEVELRDGLIHVIYDVGRSRYEFVMSASSYLRAVSRCNEIAAEFAAHQCEVIPVEFDSKFERRFPKDKIA